VKRKIMKRSHPLIEERSGPLIVQGEFHNFRDWEKGGEKSFDFSICEIPTRSGPLDIEEREPSDLDALKYRNFGSRGCEGSFDLEVASRKIPIRKRRIWIVRSRRDTCQRARRSSRRHRLKN
jgi:hypothetical protein